MKRFLLMTILLSVTLLGVGLLTIPVRAAESVPMTEAHIERIRNHCVDAQSTLFQLQASDAGLRVNRGQLYESMATKLMAPLNSRIVLNRLDSVTLVSITDEYEKQWQQFRSQYQAYEEAMSATLDMDCVNQPVAFYDSVSDTREKRLQTHESAMALHRIIQQYGQEFEVFAKNFQADES